MCLVCVVFVDFDEQARRDPSTSSSQCGQVSLQFIWNTLWMASYLYNDETATLRPFWIRMRGRCAGDAWLFVDNAAALAAGDDDVVIETEIHIKLLLVLHSACCVLYVSGTRQPTKCLELSKYVCMVLRMELNKLRVRRTIASSFVQFRRISYIAMYIYCTG